MDVAPPHQGGHWPFSAEAKHTADEKRVWIRFVFTSAYVTHISDSLPNSDGLQPNSDALLQRTSHDSHTHQTFSKAMFGFTPSWSEDSFGLLLQSTNPYQSGVGRGCRASSSLNLLSARSYMTRRQNQWF